MTQTDIRTTKRPPDRPRISPLERLFRVNGRGSTVGREVRGGVTTFFAMAYIVVLNPLILGSSADMTGAHLSSGALTTATALSAGVVTILMGVVGNAPLALAASLTLNGIVAFTLAPSMTWAQAFGLVVLEGLCIVVTSVSGLRERIINAIPAPLKTAMTVGVGLFIALVGLVSAGIVTRTPDSAHSDVPVLMGVHGHLHGWPSVVFCVGLLLMIVLLSKKVPGAVLISIVVATVLAIVVQSISPSDGWGLVTPKVPGNVVAAPDFSLLGHIDLFGGFGSAGAINGIVFLFTLVLSGFFDAVGTITSVCGEAGMAHKGKIEGMGRILFVDGLGAVAGGVAGSAPNGAFLESAAGVGEGARTGLASVVTGLMLSAAILFTPITAVVPSQAAAPALVIIGGMMMMQCRHIPWNDPDVTIPVFLTVALIPFTYSITNGIGAGVIAFSLIKLVRGKWRDIGPLVAVIAVLFVAYFGIDAIEAAFH
ncbi:MAG: NCS2 family permease [Sciscionella sp.]